jgi:hypothetical protein
VLVRYLSLIFVGVMNSMAQKCLASRVENMLDDGLINNNHARLAHEEALG